MIKTTPFHSLFTGKKIQNGVVLNGTVYLLLPWRSKGKGRRFFFPFFATPVSPSLSPPPTCLKTRTNTPTCPVIMMKKREGSYALRAASGRLYIDRLMPPYPVPWLDRARWLPLLPHLKIPDEYQKKTWRIKDMTFFKG